MENKGKNIRRMRLIKTGVMKIIPGRYDGKYLIGDKEGHMRCIDRDILRKLFNPFRTLEKRTWCGEARDDGWRKLQWSSYPLNPRSRPSVYEGKPYGFATVYRKKELIEENKGKNFDRMRTIKTGVMHISPHDKDRYYIYDKERRLRCIDRDNLRKLFNPFRTLEKRTWCGKPLKNVFRKLQWSSYPLNPRSRPAVYEGKPFGLARVYRNSRRHVPIKVRDDDHKQCFNNGGPGTGPNTDRT
jgi:hypothetical protein